MNSLKIKLKFKRFKPGGLWAELRAACQVYFVWAAMLAFGLGVALRELGVWALPAVGLPAALVLVGLAATAALLAQSPSLAFARFFVVGPGLERLGRAAPDQLCGAAGRGGVFSRPRGAGFGAGGKCL